MSTRMKGIHHVTAIAGNAQENLDFYVGVLGMRLVKRSVNQDSPGTYHLFYADGEGHPGTDLTFFPWPDLPAARKGTGLAGEVSLAIPEGSGGFWRERLRAAGVSLEPPRAQFGETAHPFRDPHGMELALVETSDPREFTSWSGSAVPERHQIRGIHAVSVWEQDAAATIGFLTDTLGFRVLSGEGDWTRLASATGRSGEFVEIREAPGVARGAWGTGGVHHVAWRMEDAAAEAAMRDRVSRAGRRPSPVIDRFWFESVYFTEPGGALFELATDGPGFAVDEDPHALGESLVLPPWLEPMRQRIEQQLPPLELHSTPATGGGVD